MNVALAHHWLVGMRGGEKVLEQLAGLFPQSPIYTLVTRAEKLSAALRRHAIHPSWLNRLPGAHRRYRLFLPLFPSALRRLKVPAGTGLLLSSDASVLKGIQCPSGTPHVCYCHSPPRYLWDLQDTYLKRTSGLGMAGRLLFKATASWVREFDRAAAQRVSHFVANSQFVRARIQRAYDRDSVVIYPPVEVEDFTFQRPASDFYLIISELTSYKRIDLAVDAFNFTGQRLLIIGDGPEMDFLKVRARPNIVFLGRLQFGALKEHLETCKALIFPGVEDFGITVLEAQAAGRPVIAFRGGGVLETIVEGKTGLFFDRPTAESLAASVQFFESGGCVFSPQVCRDHAADFRPERFRAEIKSFLCEHYPGLFENHLWPV